MRPQPLAAALTAALALPAYATDAVTDPDVITILIRKPRQLLAAPDQTQFSPAKLEGISNDGGEMLRDLPGVSGSRMGGVGIDPVIRGQSQTRLNVLLDGAYIHGGCPNRMDPPTSYVSPLAYDQVTVLRGVQSVLYGGGGSGGTVLFERTTPRFTEDEAPRLRFDTGYLGNADARNADLDLSIGTPDAFARFGGSWQKSGNYQDGSGRTVRSAFDARGGRFTFGLTPDADTRLEFDIDRAERRDVLFAGAGMDSPEDNATTLRIGGEKTGLGGAVSAVRGEFYRAQVDHLMDNYSLRPLAPGAMKMSVPTTSDTTGGRFSFDVPMGDGTWTFGADFQRNERMAVRYAGPTLAMTQSILWPDVDIEQWGVFAELAQPLGDGRKLKAGLRADFVDPSAGAADRKSTTGTPNQLYRRYYGYDAGEADNETNIGGLLRLEQRLDESLTAFAGVSRSLRTADATERFLAGGSPTPTSVWVGNPGLDPEDHRQIDLGLNWQGSAADAQISLFYDWAHDFILRDRAAGQSGILKSDGATIYRNVDARLYGAELTFGAKFTPQLAARGELSYVRGRNIDDDRNIAQIPPLSGRVSLDWDAERWSAGAQMRFAARQENIDLTSGLDLRETPAWAVLDLYGATELRRGVRLSLGVDNVFDREYAYALNRASAFDPTVTQVNEPGRSAWLKLAVDL